MCPLETLAENMNEIGHLLDQLVMAEHWCSQLKTLPARLQVIGRNWGAGERKTQNNQREKEQN